MAGKKKAVATPKAKVAKALSPEGAGRRPPPPTGKADGAPRSGKDEAQALLDLLTLPVSAAYRDRMDVMLARRLADDPDDTYAALREALSQGRLGQVVLIDVDWKDIDDLQDSLREVAACWSLKDGYQAEAPDDVDEGLQAFADWVKKRGHRFLWWDSDDDSRGGLVVRERDLAEVLRLAKLHGVRLAEAP
jgi:hypothetical protein